MKNSGLAKSCGMRAALDFSDKPGVEARAVAVAGLRRASVQLYFAISSTEPGIASAIKAIKESMRVIAVCEDWARRAELSLQEALVNGHYHGNGGDPAKELRVGCILSPLRFELYVEDDGTGYHGAMDFSTPQPTATHGRGLFLIHQLMDRVVFAGNGNRIVMFLGRE